MITVTCKEREGLVTHTIEPLYFSVESISRFYAQASKFPVLFGKEIKTPEDFTNLFISYSYPSNDPIINGLFWSVDNLDTGIFYLTNIFELEADAHFAFFDKKLKGREPLVRAMMRHVFDTYGFNRLNVSIPRYVNKIHTFARSVGCRVEGEKRGASLYKDKWFDVRLYGILKNEILTESNN